jgi:myo-inositol-1(or 4)-monophosphatase
MQQTECLKQERNTAFKAALEAGRLIASRLGDVQKVDYKSAFNLVTDVDKASEKLILEILRKDFPDDEFLAEESGASKQKSKRRWLIDPLDGTTNFAHSYPFFCVSIGLEVDGQSVLGVVFNPISDELFWAQTSEGAWLNDQKISVSKVNTVEESLLATGFPPNTEEAHQSNLDHFNKLTGLSHGVRRDGSAALDLCFVACGRLDGFWERKLSPWDLGAGVVIVKEAGGKISDFAGGNFDMQVGNIVATNVLIHEEVVAALDES